MSVPLPDPKPYPGEERPDHDCTGFVLLMIAPLMLWYACSGLLGSDRRTDTCTLHKARRTEVVIAIYGDIHDTQEAETDTKTKERTLNSNP